MISLKIGGIIVAAFIAGAFVASPELRAYAAGTVTSADIVDGTIQSIDIGTGQVKNSDIGASAVTNSKLATNSVSSSKLTDGQVALVDLAANSVDSSKIADGTMIYADLSRSFVAIEHRDDCNCGGTGWDPDGTGYYEQIADDRITLSSVVSVTLINVNNIACGTAQLQSGNVVVSCERIIPQGSAVNYAIFNK